jgi:hypothetical protein
VAYDTRNGGHGAPTPATDFPAARVAPAVNPQPRNPSLDRVTVDPRMAPPPSPAEALPTRPTVNSDMYPLAPPAWRRPLSRLKAAEGYAASSCR